MSSKKNPLNGKILISYLLITFKNKKYDFQRMDS